MAASVSFAQDISKFVKATGLKQDTILRKLALDCFTRMILRSPVDTGRFRASWRVGVDRIDFSEHPFIATRGAAISPPQVAAMESILKSAVYGKTIFITNNLHYGPRLEDGWSRQAPQGVMRITLIEVAANFAKTVASVT